MSRNQNPTEPWRAVIVAVVLVTALSACQKMPVEMPTPTPTAHSSPYTVMQAMIERSMRGDHLAFSELLAYDTTYNLAQMGEIIARCTGHSAMDVPFDVEYERSDLAAGQIGSPTGFYKVYMERFDGEWFISEIQGAAEACPF